jgi:hypothetical protein
MFMPYLTHEIRMSHESARLFMNVAPVFGDNPKILDFAPSILFELAKPSTPESTRIEALSRAEQGKIVKHAIAREIIQEHRAPTGHEEDALDAQAEDWNRAVHPRYLSPDDVFEAGEPAVREECAEELVEYQAAGGALTKEEQAVVAARQEPTRTEARAGDCGQQCRPQE